MRIGYVHYGSQSGVTAAVARELEARGHRVQYVDATGPLELRDRRTRLPRPTPAVLTHLALSALQFGRRALFHRWNTPFAFDVHSRKAGQRLAALPQRPDLLLQNGAIFSPGLPPDLPYVLYLDYTMRLAVESGGAPELGLSPIPDPGPGWYARESRLYRGARAIATFSARVRDSLVGGYGVDPGHVAVVGAGANVFPARAEHRDDGETVLFVGKNEFAIKGGFVLLRAFERLRLFRPQARLLLAGPTEPLELPTGAVCLGRVQFDRMPDLFAQATVFTLPTLREPFGIAFLDAMACGVPCVGTDIEAVPEIVADGQTGLLVPPKDDVALCDALLSLLADPPRRRTMGEVGRRTVARRFLWSHVGDRLDALLRDAVLSPAA